MIDWLTLKVDATVLGAEQVARLRGLSGRVLKLAADGSIEWETVARESIRSDSHQVTIQMGGDLQVSGSPARVMGTHNVFGSGDIRECASAMLAFVCCQLSMTLPHLERWRCTRVDVTHNFDLLTEANVRQALQALRHAEGGRYQLRTAADSVYWSPQSHVRSAKAYAKGPHVAFQRRKGLAQLTDDEAELSKRLLRLELSLRSQYWREHSKKVWHEHSEDDLDVIFEGYFSPLIGSVEVSDMNEVLGRVQHAAIEKGVTEGQARAAYLYWTSICNLGFEHVRGLTSKSTHYRHVKLLRAAGLSFADFQARRVVPLRRAALVLSQPVRSFDQLRRAA